MTRSIVRFALYCVLAFAVVASVTLMMIAVLCEVTLRREKSIVRRRIEHDKQLMATVMRVMQGRGH